MSAFETLVAEALDALPEYVCERIDNVAVVVEERPEPTRARALGFRADQDLLGLYEGVPQEQRGTGYHLVVPDRITLFRQPILDQVGNGGREAVVAEIRATIIHEFAHHFGMSDAELEELEGPRIHAGE